MHRTDCRDSMVSTAHQTQTRIMATFSEAYSNRAKAIAKTQSRQEQDAHHMQMVVFRP